MKTIKLNQKEYNTLLSWYRVVEGEALNHDKDEKLFEKLLSLYGDSTYE